MEIDLVEEFDKEWKTGDRKLARAIAEEFTEANREMLDKRWGRHSIEAMVAIIAHLGDQGRERDRIMADMYIMAKFPPQNIVGELNINGQQAVAAAMRVISKPENRAERRRRLRE